MISTCSNFELTYASVDHVYYVLASKINNKLNTKYGSILPRVGVEKNWSL